MFFGRSLRRGSVPLGAILGVAAGLGAAACAAPSAERATGAVAEAVERALASGAAGFDHSDWDALLRVGTSAGLVDYSVMAGRRAELDAYVARLAAADLGALERDELMALLINAYNALTVVAILDHPDVASIREIDGVWTELEWTVGGHALTLDNIEHNVLRPFFLDPRIHFVVNCASLSCAPLPRWAYTGAELEAQLEERSRAFLTDPANVSLEGGRLKLSRYFEWYGSDFTTAGWEPRAESIPAFVARYATDEVRAAVEGDPGIAFDFADYDWSLNTVEVLSSASSVRPAEPASPVTAAEPVSPPLVTASLVQAEGEELGFGAWLVTWLRETVASLGWLGPFFYGLVYALAVVLFVPGSALTLAAGVTFGLGLGTLTVFVAANTGAALAFLIARYVLRDRVERLLAGRPALQAVDRAVETQGWRIVFLTRLSPVFPFNAQNYFYGLTGVTFYQYVAASLVGMLPGTLLYVYIGAAGAEVAEASGGAASWGQTALLVAGLVATAGVVVLVTRVARRELNKALAEVEAPPESPAS
ncbi:VTT domain-containing protein [Candidatus Palauibacter sp.]|uniref:VTT domain-containing protein n=1 Tax=Candidatus Palauibacter sp. TaxID=3101350 RepID=UPI003B01B779